MDVVHSIDNDRLSKLHLPTGRIKRRIRQLKKVEDRGFCALNVSQNGTKSKFKRQLIIKTLVAACDECDQQLTPIRRKY